MTVINSFLYNLWWMIAESAPWLLLGFVIAGVINRLLPPSWITNSLGKKGFSSICRAAFIGAPLPLCSCGVIPTAMGIRRAGASRGATASFLVATPETGVDSVSISYALMGPVMAIARPISAIVSAIVSGTLVEKLTKNEPDDHASSIKKSCCSSSSGHTNKSTSATKVEKPATAIEVTKEVLSFSFGKLLKDITYWLAIGLVGAALIKTFVPTSFFLQWGSGIWAMLAMVVVGIPMYICATASTPLAASLILAGISPGTALVFMLTGPATNIATLGVIKNELGVKALFGYLTGVVVTAIVMGIGLDTLIADLQLSMPLMSAHEHSEISLFSSVSAIVLILLTLLNYLPKRGVFSLKQTEK